MVGIKYGQFHVVQCIPTLTTHPLQYMHTILSLDLDCKGFFKLYVHHVIKLIDYQVVRQRRGNGLLWQVFKLVLQTVHTEEPGKEVLQ